MQNHALKNLRLLSLTDRELIQGYFRAYPPRISEFTFTNLFAWRFMRPIWFAEFDSTLVFFSGKKEAMAVPDAMFGPPVGPADLPEIVRNLGRSLCSIERLPAEFAERLEKEGLAVTTDRDNWDYLYRVADLAELAGRKYARKRNHLKQCLEENSCAYVALDEGNIGECLQMQERWCRARECSRDPGLCAELAAIKETLTHFATFGLLGGAIRINGEIMAYAIGERLNRTTAVCHFEKAMPGIHGLSQLINNWFARHELKDFEFSNREQDLGIPGIRQAKESYFPCAMVEKVRVRLAPQDPGPGGAASRCF